MWVNSYPAFCFNYSPAVTQQTARATDPDTGRDDLIRQMRTMYLMVPKMRQGGYVPFFVSDRKRSEAALIQVVQEAFINGVSTRKWSGWPRAWVLRILSRSQVSNMTKEMDEQVEAFRSRPLAESRYPVLWVDALYEKVRYDGHVVSMAILLVCGVNEAGTREVLAVEPMLEESQESYSQLFEKLKKRGLQTPSLMISDAHAGLVAAIRRSFPVLPGSAARSISCGISWPIFHIEKRKRLRANSSKSGWLPMRRLP